jgi:CDP-glucose 4,6-dehydratase
MVLNEASNEIPRQFLSAAKARRMLNWTPSFSFQEGLARTIQWYRDHDRFAKPT